MNPLPREIFAHIISFTNVMTLKPKVAAVIDDMSTRLFDIHEAASYGIYVHGMRNLNTLVDLVTMKTSPYLTARIAHAIIINRLHFSGLDSTGYVDKSDISLCIATDPYLRAAVNIVAIHIPAQIIMAAHLPLWTHPRVIISSIDANVWKDRRAVLLSKYSSSPAIREIMTSHEGIHITHTHPPCLWRFNLHDHRLIGSVFLKSGHDIIVDEYAKRDIPTSTRVIRHVSEYTPDMFVYDGAYIPYRERTSHTRVIISPMGYTFAADMDMERKSWKYVPINPRRLSKDDRSRLICAIVGHWATEMNLYDALAIWGNHMSSIPHNLLRIYMAIQSSRQLSAAYGFVYVSAVDRRRPPTALTSSLIDSPRNWIASRIHNYCSINTSHENMISKVANDIFRGNDYLSAGDPYSALPFAMTRLRKRIVDTAHLTATNDEKVTYEMIALYVPYPYEDSSDDEDEDGYDSENP